MWFYMIFLAAFILIALSHWYVRRISPSKTLKAYKERHPELVKNGVIKCSGCGGTRINVERLMNQTYRRRHYCKTCGTTLYETKEK